MLVFVHPLRQRGDDLLFEVAGVPAFGRATMAPISSRLRSTLLTMKPANGAARPMINAGTVSTIGTRTATPGVPAKCWVSCGRAGGMTTAPSTDMQLPASSRINWARPARRGAAAVLLDRTAGASPAVEGTNALSDIRGCPST